MDRAEWMRLFPQFVDNYVTRADIHALFQCKPEILNRTCKAFDGDRWGCISADVGRLGDFLNENRHILSDDVLERVELFIAVNNISWHL